MAEASSTRTEPRLVKVRRKGARHRSGKYLLYDSAGPGVTWGVPVQKGTVRTPNHQYGWQAVRDEHIVKELDDE